MRHSGEGRNPGIALFSGCRIMSGMTKADFLETHLGVISRIVYLSNWQPMRQAAELLPDT